MSKIISDDDLDAIFRDARTHSSWTDEPVSDIILHALYDLVKYGPTSANCLPMRLVFVRSPEAKEKLRPTLSPGNVDKTMSAPVTAIIAYDTKFYDHLPKLYPPADARSWFAGDPAKAEEAAFRNSSLQGGYLIIAARALGLDCGPMSGFEKDKLNAAFFPDGRFKVNFLCNLGYGSGENMHPRLPRLDFTEACEVV